MLADAKSLCDQGRFRSAADRAYYVMFHAAQAALAGQGAKAPRTHKGLRSMFGERLVATGLVEREYSRDLTKAFELRQESTYEAFGEASEAEVADLIGRSERFLDRVAALLGEQRS